MMKMMISGASGVSRADSAVNEQMTILGLRGDVTERVGIHGSRDLRGGGGGRYRCSRSSGGVVRRAGVESGLKLLPLLMQEVERMNRISKKILLRRRLIFAQDAHVVVN